MTKISYGRITKQKDGRGTITLDPADMMLIDTKQTYQISVSVRKVISSSKRGRRPGWRVETEEVL